MKTVTTATLTVGLLVVISCQTQSHPSRAEPPASPPQPPAMGLHLAALQGEIDTVRQHIAAGSELNQRDAYGSTPLIIAVSFGKTDVVRALLEAGADMEITNNDGSTPLQIAALFGRTKVVGALLEKGANRYARNNFGMTAFDIVAAPFEDDKALYDSIALTVGPLGLTLDHEAIKSARPEIAEMLRPRPEELAAVTYAPLPGEGWKVSTPAEQGLDPMLVAQLYLDAAEMETLYGLLVLANDQLIAEGYFHEGTVEQKALLQSVTKSYTSALVGIALDRGCLTSVDQKLLDFFPEFADRITDPRKKRITVRDLLQMRAGYPWEEKDPALWKAVLSGDYLPLIVDFPLTHDPGTVFQYSNVSSHFLGMTVARACKTDLQSYAREHLFSKIGAEMGAWTRDRYGYYFGHAELHATARDMARLGLLYLNGGTYQGNQVVPASWVQESLQRYSKNVDSAGIRSGKVGRYFHDVSYGYQWWAARAGDHRFNLAWGHGGQFILVLQELDMVIVVTSAPFHGDHGARAWKHELANLNLIGKFIQSLPGE